MERPEEEPREDVFRDEEPRDEDAPEAAPRDPARGLIITSLQDALSSARERGASDVLVTPGAPILWRVDGDLYQVGDDVLEARHTQEDVYELLSQEQIGRFSSERELDFSLDFGAGSRFRANAYWSRGGVAASFRLVPSVVPTPEGLGLPPIVAQLVGEHQGLILVTGPTGHGKSTTLAAMIGHINQTRSAHVVTIEDPIEFQHTHDRAVIDQREVGKDTTSFAEALRRVLRQSPDVIMVGEMRDRETISAALTAAETGHLVLATLHTNDAAQSVNRIIDVFPAAQQPQIRSQLSHSLAAVLSQRLLPRSEGEGLVLACEVLVATSGVRHMIRDDKLQGIATAIDTGVQYGMQSLDAVLRELARDGVITREVAKAAARDPKRIK